MKLTFAQINFLNLKNVEKNPKRIVSTHDFNDLQKYVIIWD